MEDDNNQSTQEEQVVETIMDMPEPQREIVMAKLEMIESPLPHPEILKEYNRLYGDAAKKIIDNGVAEGEHRRKLEQEQQKADNSSRKRREWMAASISAIGILLSFALVYTNHPVGGSVFGGTMLLMILSVFLPSNSDDKSMKENEDN